MSEAVLFSIKPDYCELISLGAKTSEIRKTKPKLEPPFKCYVYCTKPKRSGDIFLVGGEHPVQGNGKVIGEFVCDEIKDYYPIDTKDPINKPYGEEIEKESCLSTKQVNDYGFRTLGYGILFGLHITDVVIYDKPRELSYFCKPVECPRGLQKAECVGCWDCEIKRPPQSWCYVKEVEEKCTTKQP